MNKIYQLIDRITPKNYWLQLLTLTFYTLFLSISFNLILLEVIGLKIESPKDGIIQKIQNNIYLYFAVLVILGPLLKLLFSSGYQHCFSTILKQQKSWKSYFVLLLE